MAISRNSPEVLVASMWSGIDITSLGHGGWEEHTQEARVKAHEFEGGELVVLRLLLMFR